MVAVMFITFIYQVVARYVFNAGTAWADEICVITWVWAVLWGTALITRGPDDIRIDLLRNALSERARRRVDAVCGLLLALIFGLGMPGAWSYVTFMKVEATPALGLRFNWVFSVYLLFALAIIVRQGWLVWEAFRAPPQPSGGTPLPSST
jgi:TRAP-type C4-dicarboxylate transport system permease small subunit